MPEIDILAIGAHMGDEVAWGAALAAHARQGLSIGLLHLTPGEKGHPTLPPEAYAAQKREEAAACAARLGASIWALDHRDGELRDDDALKFEVADVLREARPKAVVTHWAGSMHKDHAAAHRLLADAIFYAALPGFQRALPPTPGPRVFYGENWEDLEGYEPEVFVELLDEDLERWEEAMRSYALFRGGVSKFEYLDYYRALARARGCETGFRYAATFAVPPRARRRRVPSLLG
ncbi:MAG: PIG-L family deacetylase [Fimbriimonadaceae bacterium]|nr:PIG-L family deacetylase [Chthonomonadaceae bacterium]MCO5297128.1 PIG-L family deacetylase [Fimbriimonadaceae bacterium]